MEMQVPTIVEGNNGFGGAGLGAGFIGGLILGGLWNGNGWGGWGGNRAGVADATLANAIEHVSDQVTQGNIAALQTASNQNMFMGNLVNQTGDAITAAINQGTISALQSTANISEKLCSINNNITAQNYENRLQSQALAAQMQQQCCQLSREIFEQGCANRELQRQIQTEAIAGALSDAKTQNAALMAQINLTNQLQAQTSYLIDQLKTTTAAAGA